MTDDELLHRLIGGGSDELLARAATSTTPALLVAAAVRTGSPAPLVIAASRAETTRDRQLVAIADAHLRGDERFDALVCDHLVDHPDNVVAAWIAAVHRQTYHPDTRRAPC
jgi:hypothetical protein